MSIEELRQNVHAVTVEAVANIQPCNVPYEELMAFFNAVKEALVRLSRCGETSYAVQFVREIQLYSDEQQLSFHPFHNQMPSIMTWWKNALISIRTTEFALKGRDRRWELLTRCAEEIEAQWRVHSNVPISLKVEKDRLTLRFDWSK